MAWRIMGGLLVAALAGTMLAAGAGEANTRGTNQRRGKSNKSQPKPRLVEREMTVLPENLVIQAILQSPNPDVPALIAGNGDLDTKIAKRIADTFAKKKRKGLEALYNEMNKTEMANANKIWNRPIEKLSDAEDYSIRIQVVNLIVGMLTEMVTGKTIPKNHRTFNKALETAWENLILDHYQHPLVVAGLRMEMERMKRDIQNTRNGCFIYAEGILAERDGPPEKSPDGANVNMPKNPDNPFVYVS